ncbi:MAG TPA: LysR substrate-binding domain-containing protein, partial [Noviherbaspirillum sp.]|nr:LysR substrate-binding domain-containing protein [Noviherbaspirillum sp.]
TPTPAGEALLAHARQLLRGAEKMQGELSEYATGVRGHIHIYASVSAIAEFLPDDISAFLAEHGNIRVDMEERVSSQVLRTVEENSAAIGVCWDLADTRDLQVIPYKRDHLTAVVHPDHPLARRRKVSFEEILDYDLIGQAPESMMNLFLERMAAKQGRSVRNRMHVASFEAVYRIVRANLGMSIVPAEAIQPYQATLGLRVIPLSDSWAHRRFIVCMRDYDALPLPSRLFVDFLRTDQAGKDERD